MRMRLLFLVSTAFMVSHSPASASPIQLSAAAWGAAASGLTVVTEDFEGFIEGLYSSPVTLSNGVFTTSSSSLVGVFGDALFCGNATNSCLFTNSVGTDNRTFSAFATGTTLWSVADFRALQPTDIFEITAVGTSGTSVFTSGASAFFGFGDALGLTSVSFRNLGSGFARGNYTFDNVSTGSPAAATVPEPTSLTLLGAGLFGLLEKHRRRRRHVLPSASPDGKRR